MRAGPAARVPLVVMRPGVMGRPKPSSEAEQQYKADAALAARRDELLEAAREAEDRLRQAQARHAPVTELHRLAEEFDAALTAAVRAARLRRPHLPAQGDGQAAGTCPHGRGRAPAHAA